MTNRCGPRWVVGCDGAGSRVRNMPGIEYAGRTFAQPWLVVDAETDTPRPTGQTVGPPDRPAAPPDRPDRRTTDPTGCLVVEDLDGTLAPVLTVRRVAGPVVAVVRPDRVVLGCFPAPLSATALPGLSALR